MGILWGKWPLDKPIIVPFINREPIIMFSGFKRAAKLSYTPALVTERLWWFIDTITGQLQWALIQWSASGLTHLYVTFEILFDLFDTIVTFMWSEKSIWRERLQTDIDVMEFSVIYFQDLTSLDPSSRESQFFGDFRKCSEKNIWRIGTSDSFVYQVSLISDFIEILVMSAMQFIEGSLNGQWIWQSKWNALEALADRCFGIPNTRIYMCSSVPYWIEH